MTQLSMELEPEDGRKPPPAPVVRVALRFVQGAKPPLPTRIAAPLRRMAPEHWSRYLAELYPVLIGAGIPVDDLAGEAMARWASIVHLVAVLSGTGGRMAHSDARARALGAVLHGAGFSEARLMRLLSARGAMLPLQVARLARFLAAKGSVPVDLRPMADLILFTDRDAERAEAARMKIARAYFTADSRTTDTRTGDDT